ncbi:MAG: hypothetical protein NZ580_07635, partial [Bacteroidia bacterium]|nr:hypothetical protein [Bacteroidia bacterium]
LTPLLVAHGLILWASMPGVLAFFVLHTYIIHRHPAFPLWKSWVIYSYLRSMLIWLAGSFIFVSDALTVIGKVAGLWTLGVAHLAMEYWPTSAWRKRDFLRKLLEALRGNESKLDKVLESYHG